MLVLESILAATLAMLPHGGAPSCQPRAAMQVAVRIEGFRNRSGNVRVRLFGDPPSTYFDKRRTVARIEMPVPPSGPVEICVRAPGPGVYAIDVRHDQNSDGRTDRRDGGGASGNPRVSLVGMLLGRKPAPATVQFRVGAGTTVVQVTLMYLEGGVFRPVPSAR